MAKEIEVEKEFGFLAQKFQESFSTEQIYQWAKKSEFMKRKTKLKPEYFLFLCSLLGDLSSLYKM